MGKIAMGEANLGLIQKTHDSNVALGERALQSDFLVEIDGMKDLKFLFRTAQKPEIGRGEPVEDFGPNNQPFYQYGNIKKAGDWTGNIVELKDGRVRAAIIDIVENKRYVNVIIRDSGEGYTGSSIVLEKCLLRADPTDLDTSAETPQQIPLQIKYNWRRENSGGSVADALGL